MDYERNHSNYETCVICGQRKELDYFTRGGLCDRKCEACVGKDYVPEFTRAEDAYEASQMAVNTLLSTERVTPYTEHKFQTTPAELAVFSSVCIGLFIFFVGLAIYGGGVQ
jgi:hypothetical protein